MRTASNGLEGKNVLLLALVALVATLGCGDGSLGTSGQNEPDPPSPTDPADPEPPEPTDPTDPTDPGEPSEPADPCGTAPEFDSTFEGIQSVIFERHGCTAAACHGSAASGGLDLSPDVAYENIFEVPSTASASDRIEPGDEDRSYLWVKLAAGTRPGQYEIAGSPMPVGGSALTEDELELLRRWIYAGAPGEGVVEDTRDFLGGCLPEAEPIEIAPLAAPEESEGFQLSMPEWTIEASSEFEGCFATYYDVSDVAPAEILSPTGERFRFRGFEVRQDPQSHHLFMYYPLGNTRPEGVDVTHPAFGAWSCFGGEEEGTSCDPLDTSSCGSGLCASDLVESFGCIGYGPPEAGPTQLIGGAGQSVGRSLFAEGVYAELPTKGVIYWNSHAFNLTGTDGVMHAKVNYYYERDPEYFVVSITDFSSIFRPNAPPYTEETYCNDHVLPQGARLFELQTHTHQRGKHTWVTGPDGTQLYENFLFSDPVIQRYDPPLEFDSDDPADRTLTYCGTYNNGMNPDGSPNPDEVTRLTRLRAAAGDQFGGTCTPVACAAGRVGEACNGADDHAACDSSPGTGDGLCDACPITGGESTENEMFNLFGFYYTEDNRFVPYED